MADLYPHKSGLGLVEPVALINQNVALYWSDGWLYKKVTFLEPIPPFQFLNIGAVTAQNTSGLVGAANLDVKKDEFGQLRWYPLDNVQVRMWLPSANGRYSLKNLMVVVDPNVAQRDPCLHLTEFFWWEDHHPHFQAMNLMDYNLAQVRLIGMGFRYKVEAVSKDVEAAIKAGREPCTYVVCQGR